jgi:hypothetical protein
MREFMDLISTESSVVVAESSDGPEDSISGVLVEDTAAAPSVTDHFERIEETQDLSSQLNELADHADAVARAEQNGEISTEVAFLSTESMSREFRAIMRSAKLPYTASSFEAAGSDAERIEGLARDARRVSQIAMEHVDYLRDYTEEGALLSFLRRDESKLNKAHDQLDQAAKRLQKNIDKLSERPVKIRNQGFARFMTRNNRQVTDLAAAIGSEAKYLSNAHDQIESAIKAMGTMSNNLRGPGALAALNGLTNARPFTAASNLGTEEGYLMGNCTIESSETEGPYPHLLVPKYTRTSGIRIKGKSVGWAALGGLFGAVNGWAWGTIIALGGLAIGAPVIVGAAYAATPLLKVGMGLKGAVDSFNRSEDESNSRSQASASDMKKVVEMVLGYTRYTNYSVDADLIRANLKAARKNTDGMSSDQKKQLVEVTLALETSLDRLVRLASQTYEQAYYTTTLAAAIITAACNRST